MRLIRCRYCDSPYCDGCNIKILEESLKRGLLNKFMNEHHMIIKEKIVDAVPVVRCEDCKHHDTVSLNCEFLAATTLDQWYCWNGARREDNGT